MTPWLLFVLTAGFVLSATRLVYKDTILEPARAVVQARAVAAEDRADAWRLDNGWVLVDDVPHWFPEVHDGAAEPKLPAAYRAKWRGGFWPWLDDLIGCPWCVAFHVAWPACAVVVATFWEGAVWPGVVVWGLLTMSTRWVAGIVTAKTEH